VLHTQAKPVRDNGLAARFFGELREKHNVDATTFLISS
jgi:hypothetical protein